MRRYISYLTVALLAFEIGSIAAFIFYWQTLENVSTKDRETIVKAENKVRINNFSNDLKNPPIIMKNDPSEAKIPFVCNDARLWAVWKFIGKKRDLNGLIDCSTVIGVEKIVDLNNDGKKEAIVSGIDGLVNGANNRSIWFVQKIGRDYKVLLEESVEDYEIKKSVTNGFQDIFTKHHMSCCSSYQSTYKFSKGKYREGRCLFVDYGTTSNPFISTCAEEEARFEKEYRKRK